MARSTFAYALKPGESVERGFRRILLGLGKRAGQVAERTRGDVTEDVHEGRLLIKRMRALLWFAKPALDESVLERAKDELRTAAGFLAAQRDRMVTRTVLEQLKPQVAKDREALIFVAPEGKTKEADLREALGGAMRLVRSSVTAILKSARRAQTWPESSRRVERAFQQMRRAGKRARQSEKDADFHEWRKKAKNLLYQLELTRMKPSRLLPKVDELQAKLGEFHDCVVAGEHLKNHAAPSAAKRLSILLRKRKKHLRKIAGKLARRIEDGPEN